MGDQDSHSPPIIDYASLMDNTSIVPDAKKYVPDHENVLPQRSPAVEYAPDGVVLPDGTLHPSVSFESEEASTLSGGIKGITH